MPLWILVTVAAALFQCWRTAMQQKLRHLLSVNGAGFVRFLYGAATALILLIGALLLTGAKLPTLTFWTLLWAAGGGLTQILATNLLIMAFGFRNFAVGTAYAKTEAVQSAILAWLLLHETIRPGAIAGICVGLCGVLTLSLAGRGRISTGGSVDSSNTSAGWYRARGCPGETACGRAPNQDSYRRPLTCAYRSTLRAAGLKPRAILAATTEPAALCGLAAGLLFAFTSVFLKLGNQSVLAPSLFVRALSMLLLTNTLQTLMQGAWLAWQQPEELRKAVTTWRSSALVGTLSACGSACWIVGYALTEIALVRSLGQVEIVFTLLFSRFYLKETLRRGDVAGLLLVVGGVLLIVTES